MRFLSAGSKIAAAPLAIASSIYFSPFVFAPDKAAKTNPSSTCLELSVAPAISISGLVTLHPDNSANFAASIINLLKTVFRKKLK